MKDILIVKIIFDGEYKNGKAKKFNKFDILEFEGEYLNGKKSGKWKEYNYKGELIFEGEYLNNYKYKGKEYVKGKLEYEGEYLNGKKWNGKGYDENNKIIYELIDGNGKGKYYNPKDKLFHEVEYIYIFSTFLSFSIPFFSIQILAFKN